MCGGLLIQQESERKLWKNKPAKRKGSFGLWQTAKGERTSKDANGLLLSHKVEQVTVVGLVGLARQWFRNKIEKPSTEKLRKDKSLRTPSFNDA